MHKIKYLCTGVFIEKSELITYIIWIFHDFTNFLKYNICENHINLCMTVLSIYTNFAAENKCIERLINFKVYDRFIETYLLNK